MGTKSDRSSGSQFTPRGINQGVVLVDPKTGLPINTVSGKLDVNASVTATIGDIEIDAATSSIRIEDPNTGAHVKVETDGSINANVKVDAVDGDNVMAVGTEDGTTTGIKHVAKIASDGNLRVKDDAANASLSNIDSKLINLNTTPVKTIQIFTKPFDSITATYPSVTQEVYSSRVGGISGTIQETVTVNYTDSTKNLIQDVARS
jgi:hypothetical protein